MGASDKVEETVISAVDMTRRYPFLFIGSGLSKRYMGTPSWDELLRRVCDDVLEDKFAYARYLSEAKVAVERGETASELPYVATLMERDVNDALLSFPRFEPFRAANSSWLQGGGSPMRLYVADVFRGLSLHASEETDLLSDAGQSKVSGVITTNYDGLCPCLFPDYVPYVGEDDLLFRDPTYAQEIYQIHGSMDKPESLVITAADYDRFADREKYLAAKLLTIFVEYPVIFMGYSIQDPNIRAILASISRCVGPDRLGNLQDRMIFVAWKDGAEPSVGPQLMSFGDQAIGMTNVTIGDFSPIYRALIKSQKLYDTRALRELRGSVFSIVPRLDTKSKTVVASIDRAIDTLGKDDRVVIGFGQEPSDYGKSVKLVDLYRDVVLDDMMLPAALVAYSYLNDLLKHNSNAVPVYKYLDSVGIGPDDWDSLDRNLAEYVRRHDCVGAFLSDSQKARRMRYRDEHAGELDVKSLVEREGHDRAFQFVKYLQEDEIDIHELGEYLSSLMHGSDGSVSLRMLEEDTYKSEFRKCVRIYDFVRYGRGKSPGLC